MFLEDVEPFFADFSQVAIYSNDSVNKKIDVILDYDVEFIGQNGELSGNSITVTFKADSSVLIGGIFCILGVNYVVDAQVSNDNKIQVVSVVKQ